MKIVEPGNISARSRARSPEPTRRSAEMGRAVGVIVPIAKLEKPKVVRSY